MTKNIMIVGVGGQGSLLASKLLGHLLLSEGYDVKVSEVRQRRHLRQVWRKSVFSDYRQRGSGRYRFV